MCNPYCPARSSAVEVLHCKPEGRGFDSRWCLWNLSLTILPAAPGPGVDSDSNRNEYHVYFLWDKSGWCVRLTTLPPSCSDFLEIWEPQPPGTLRSCPGLYRDCFTFTFYPYCSLYRVGQKWFDVAFMLNTLATTMYTGGLTPNKS